MATNEKPIETLEDIFESDIFKMVCPQNEQANEIFNLKHVSKPSESKKKREIVDFVARLEPCANFSDFEYLFIDMHQALNDKSCKTIHGSEIVISPNSFEEGQYFIIRGLLCYLASIEDLSQTTKDRQRVLLITENGCQSRMLLSSLGKTLRDNDRSGLIVPAI